MQNSSSMTVHSSSSSGRSTRMTPRHRSAPKHHAAPKHRASPKHYKYSKPSSTTRTTTRTTRTSSSSGNGKKPSYVLPLVIAAGVGLAIFALTKKSSAAGPQGPQGTPGGMFPPSPTAFPPSTPILPVSAGTTRFITAPSGLKLRAGPGVNFPEVPGSSIAFGTRVQVAQDVANGWTQLSSPPGFVCNTCVEAPGGPWLSPTPPALAAVPGSPPSMPAVTPGGVVISTTVPGVNATVIAPSGLNLRTGAGTNFTKIGLLKLGTPVTILQSLPNGWTHVQPSTGPAGFVCSSCADAPGGPWLSSPGSVSSGYTQYVPLG